MGMRTPRKGLLFVAVLTLALASPAAEITIPNFSFEYVNGQPVTTRLKGVTPDNWTFDAGNSLNGPSPQSSEGNVCVAVGGVESIYQTLSETAAADTAYTLKFDGYYHWSTGSWNCTFRGILYYNSGNSRVEIDHVEFQATKSYEWKDDCTLEVTIPSGHAAVGKELGIELAVVAQSGSTYAFDNVRLTSAELRTSPSTFYVDSLTGSDGNSGLATNAAWQTLAPVNSLSLIPGDQILFRAGSSYTGQLAPSGSGAAGSPILIDMYGTGDKPLIEGQGLVNPTLLLENIEYIDVRNLEISNTGAAAEAGRMGVYLHLNNFGTANDVTLRGLHVRDVNGSNVKKDGGGVGIKWHVEGSVPSRYDGLLIENCHLERCDRDGIKGGSAYWTRDNWHPSLNVVIRGNLLEDIGGDGIVAIGTDGALVEHNVVRDAGQRIPQGDAAAGIWPWSADNTVIQYNEVSGMRGPWDAQGFDSDWNCTNTLIQYNYSHDNLGGFLLICTPGDMGLPGNIGNIGTVVRYNLSVNDGFQPTVLSPTFHISGNVTDTKIYNNTIVVGTNDVIEIFNMNNWGGVYPDNTEVYNNIFYAAGTTGNKWGASTGNTFSNNIWSGPISNLRGDEVNRSTADPLLVNPGGSSAEHHKVLFGSGAISDGVLIAGNGGLDYFSNSISAVSQPTLGFHEYSSDTVIDSDGDTMTDFWETQYGLNAGSAADASANPDGDQLLNLGEFALGGNPTNGADTGYAPTCQVVDPGGGSNRFVYVYPRRTDWQERGLTYDVGTTTNLVTGPWVNAAHWISGVEPEAYGPGFDAVTNHLSIDNAIPERFIRLEVD